jgi:uncharacterized protein
MNSSVLWLEIPVSNFIRAVNFYETVFKTKLQITILFDKQMALFTKEQFGLKGALVETENYLGSNGIKPFYYIDVMSEAIEAVLTCNGKVISEPTLMRQKNKNGDVIIGTNLIDNQVGYYAEVTDSEGNHFYLYSHS